MDEQALRAARRISQGAAHSMSLEKPGVEANETEAQIDDLARTLKDEMSSVMWDD